MKSLLATFAIAVLAVGSAAAQQSNNLGNHAASTTSTGTIGSGTNLEQNSAGSVTSGSASSSENTGTTNAAKPNQRTNPRNGTKASAGLNNTLEQNSAGTVTAGAVDNGAPTTTTTDARSSTMTSAPKTKARTKRSELVNLKPNKPN